MSDQNDSELNDIIEGFKLFGSEENGLIKPTEVKEIMEIMNMNEKSPFLYNIVTNLCTNEEIQKKGGINAEEFISLLDQELDDTSTIEGLQKIFSIFSDNNTSKISLPIISEIFNQEGDWGLGEDEEKIKKLLAREEISGKKINFDEFQDIMKTEKEKRNIIYRKKTSINSNSKNNSNDNILINNNINPNNNKFHESNSNSEKHSDINNDIQNKNILENNNNINEINQDEINDNNINNDKNENDINSVNPEYKLNKAKKKYRYMNKSSDNSQDKENSKEEKEMSNISNSNKNSNVLSKNNLENNDKEDEKIDKTEKRYHRRYRDAKSPSKKQNEENSVKENQNEENNNNKRFSYSHWRFRGKK